MYWEPNNTNPDSTLFFLSPVSVYVEECKINYEKNMEHMTNIWTLICKKNWKQQCFCISLSSHCKQPDIKCWTRKVFSVNYKGQLGKYILHLPSLPILCMNLQRFYCTVNHGNKPTGGAAMVPWLTVLKICQCVLTDKALTSFDVAISL